VRQEFDRLTFFLIGPEAASISFPFEKQNVDLPSAAHVVVLRCSSHSPTALAVILPEQKEVLFSSDFDEGCSE
jgi:glyoxylase-like metal-dependent hydrolase (beta-lactamase superfamily II)